MLTGAFCAGMLVDRQLAAPTFASAGRASQPPQFKTFWQAWEIVQKNYFDRELARDDQKLTYGAIRGMVDSLGDEGHTRFLTPAQNKKQTEELAGEFDGIGAQVNVRDGRIVIVAPVDGAPAQRAGIKPGDIILKVNGEDVTGQALDEVVSKIRGKAGTQVTLTLARPRENLREFDLTITRDKIPDNPVTSYVLPESKIALIRLSTFSRNATSEIQNAVKRARDAGAEAAIIDVRTNSGGLLDQAIKLSSQFLAEGTPIVQQRGPQGTRTLTAEGGGVALDLPIVVLTNNYSASAAEIFAGAIKSAGRGTVIGERTFGTGTVLTPYELEDGSAILLGTAEWLTPDGRSLRRQANGEGGVEPNIVVQQAPNVVMLPPQAAQIANEAEILASDDAQLRKAVEVLHDQLAGKTTASAGR